jgi:hypothetical protein
MASVLPKKEALENHGVPHPYPVYNTIEKGQGKQP